MSYVMESEREGRRIEYKTNKSQLLDELSWIVFGANAKVMDLGCAAGTTSRIIKEIVGENGKVVGIDASETRINEARSISGGVEYRLGRAESLPADDEEFDVSWSRFTFEYFKDPLPALREMMRVTKKGGTVAVADMDGNCLWHYPTTPAFEEKLAEAIAFLGTAGFDPLIGRKLYSLFKKAGLKDIEVDIRPYHKIAGKIAPAVDELWKIKLGTINDNLVKMGWDTKKAGHIVAAYLDVLRDENSFSYSTLITVKGRKQ